MKQFYHLLLVGCLLFAVQFTSAQLALKINVVEPSSRWERFAFKTGVGAELLYQGYWRNSWRFRAGAGVTNYSNRYNRIPVALRNYEDTWDDTMYPGYKHYQKYRKFGIKSKSCGLCI